MNRARAHRFRLAPAALLCACALAGSAQAADVLIYRCTDERGQLTLRDTPCTNGQRQQTVTMTRPVDPPPRVVEAAAATSPRLDAQPNPRPQVLMMRTPQALYDCTRPDGSTYTSSNGDGNPRTVPLVDVAYGAPIYTTGTSLGSRIGARTPQLGEASAARFAATGRRGNVQYAASGSYSGGYYERGYDYGYSGVYYGSQLVRDECRQLPQQEVCSRLRDQRYQGDRRYNSALQSERAQITQQQRGIDAQLNADCGAY